MPRCLCGRSIFRARPGLRALALPSQLSIEDPERLGTEDPDPVGTVNSGLSSSPPTASRSRSQLFDSASPACVSCSGPHGVALPFQLSTFNYQLSIEGPDRLGTVDCGLSSSPPTASRSHSQLFDSARFRRL